MLFMEHPSRYLAALAGAALLTVLPFNGGSCQENGGPADVASKMTFDWGSDPMSCLRKTIEEQGLHLPRPEEKRFWARAHADVSVASGNSQDDYYENCIRGCSSVVRTDRCLRWERDSYEPGFPPSWTCVEWETRLITPEWCTQWCNRATPGPACRPFGKPCSSNKQCCSKSCTSGTCDL